MKLSKIFILASAVLAFAACSEEETWNSAKDATVSMGQEAVSVKESKGLFTLPIVVTGERNAPVQVTVEVIAAETNPATEDKHYLITTKTINIAAEDEAGEVEIIAVDDDEINEAREFTVNIISAKGATVNQEKKSTVVTLKDNDSAFYEKLAGKWTMTGKSYFDGSDLSWVVNVIAADEDDEDYNKYLYVTGMNGRSSTMAVLSYDYDMATNKGTLAFEMGVLFAQANFTGLGLCNVYLYSVVNDELVTDPVSGTWSEDFKTLSFESTPIYGAVFDGSDTFRGGWFGIEGVKMTRQ